MSNSVEAADRRSAITLALETIQLVAGSREPLSMIQISRSLGAAKSTTHRVLANLVSDGVVERREIDKTYHLVNGWSRISAQAEGEGNLVRLFFQEAEGRLKDLNETLQIGIRTEAEVTFVAYVDSPRPVRLACKVGRRLPLYASATGKALLAFAPDDEVSAALPKVLTPLTAHTVTDFDQLQRDLELTRRRGYALEEQESSRNLSCISAPILGTDGNAVAALTVCLPMDQVTASYAEVLAPRIVDAAGQIAARMG